MKFVRFSSRCEFAGGSGLAAADSWCFLLAVWHALTLHIRPVQPAAPRLRFRLSRRDRIRQAHGQERARSGRGGQDQQAFRRSIADGQGDSGQTALRTPSTTTDRTTKASAIQLAYSLGRVGLGFLIAMASWRIPLGFLIGMSPLVADAHSIRSFRCSKPISPLAWMPLALYTIKDSDRLAASS